MQITKKEISPTRILLSIVVDETEMAKQKEHTLRHFQSKVKVSGFRVGKAPLHLVEKNVDTTNLQSDFLEEAINSLYRLAIAKEEYKTFGQPNVSLTKFVPYTTLEFDAEIEVLGKVKLADYKKIKKKLSKSIVTDDDINEVISSLKERSATRESVKRPAKLGDEVVIDFVGVDSNKNAIKGADGKDYPLILGSKVFIPGFEDKIIGMNAGQERKFTLTFPKNYGVKALASKKVTFTVTVNIINELTEPKLDDDFASKVGPFKSVAELKIDIKKHLDAEKQNQARRQLENDLIKEIVDKSTLDLPQSLIDEQIDRIKSEIRQNLTYRGQTWQEMLEDEGVSEEEYSKKQIEPEAKNRVKTGLLLAEISNIEKIEVTPKELEMKMQNLKDQYTDPKMQAELMKPEARYDIASRLLTEKTIQKLVDLATKN